MKQKKIPLSMKSFKVDRRIHVILFLIAAVFTVLVFRLWTIQVYNQADYKLARLGNVEREVEIQSARGDIRDRYGRVLARDVSNRDIWITIGKKREITSAVRTSLELLSEILDKPYESFKQAYLHKERESKRWEIRVAERIPPHKYVILEERKIEFPEEAMIYARKVPTRYYHNDTLAAHILGYTGPIDKKEKKMERYDKYAPYSLIGKTGIEKQYESYLHGSDGINKIIVDKNEIQRGSAEEIKPAIPGNNVILNIDNDYQLAAEQILGVSEGVIIVSDPRDNSIMAMASNPRYHPKYYRDYLYAPNRPLFDRAIQGKYEPGSVFKIFEAFALLEELKISPDYEVYCPGVYTNWDLKMRCHKATGHGYINLYDAITLSCNVYFYTMVGEKMCVDGGRRLRKWAMNFGFEDKTGIDLPDEAAATIFPSKETERFTAQKKWYHGNAISHAIGQGGVLFTPLQVNTALCAIANGGTLYKPQLAQKIISPKGESIKNFEPEIAGKIEASTKTFEIVKKAMWEVVNNPRGTGRRLGGFKDVDFTMAGKTGTAQPGNRGVPHAWFVCYGPFEKPEIAITVLIVNGGHGGDVASPLAKQFLDIYLGNGKLQDLVMADTPVDPLLN